MAVEIKELVIRAVVENGNDNNRTVQSTASNDNLVRECIDEIMRIIRQKEER